MSGIRFPPAIPTLAADELVLRELGEQDLPAWFERATDAESADLAGDPVPASPEMGRAWLETHRDQFRRRRGLRWAIVPTGASASVGTIGLSLGPGNQRSAALGIVVARACWGQGLGSAAVRRVARYAFAGLGLHEIRAEVLQRNPASIRLLEKTGFKRVRLLPATAAEPEALWLYALCGADPSAP